MTHVVVEERDPQVAQVLVDILDRSPDLDPVPVGGWEELRRAVALHPGTVVVLGPSADDSDLHQAMRTTREFSGTTFVHVVDRVDAHSLQKAMRHGIRDVVDMEDADAELASAVARAADMGRHLVAVPSTQARSGKVVTIFGPKGGTGKTTVATNLAVLLAESGTSTALMDAAVRFGDCAAFLRIRPERSLFDIASISGELDESILQSVMSTHDSGLRVLAAPLDVMDAEKLDGDLVARAIRGLRKAFDVVVVDTSPALDDFTLAALGEADVGLLVTSLDLPAVKNAKLCLSTLERFQLGLDNVHIILNRANSKVGFPPDEVRKALGREVVASLSSDVAVPRSVNNGIVVQTENRKSKIAKEFWDLANDLRQELVAGTPGGARRFVAAAAAQPRIASS